MTIIMMMRWPDGSSCWINRVMVMVLVVSMVCVGDREVSLVTRIAP